MPVEYYWGWHHHVPGFAVWMLIVALVVVPKANRRPKAWLVLVPPILVIVLWQCAVRLLALPDTAAQWIGIVVHTAAMAWAIIWLMGHWLKGQHPAAAALLVSIALLAGGALSYLGYFGNELSDEVLLLVLMYGICVLSLIPAIGLSGYFRRGKLAAKRLVLWLALWIALAVLASMLVVTSAGTVFQSVDPYLFVFFLIQVIIVSVVLGGALYFLNLPLMRLADGGATLSVRGRITYDLSKPADPTTKPVCMEDVAGPWQFYLDQTSRTVIIELDADGSFAQTIMSNQGEDTKCPKGTWKLDGARIFLDGYTTTRDRTRVSRTWWVIDTPDGFGLLGGDTSDPESYFHMTQKNLAPVLA